jgi:hypothetical protein
MNIRPDGGPPVEAGRPREPQTGGKPSQRARSPSGWRVLARVLLVGVFGFRVDAHDGHLARQRSSCCAAVHRGWMDLPLALDAVGQAASLDPEQRPVKASTGRERLHADRGRRIRSGAAASGIGVTSRPPAPSLERGGVSSPRSSRDVGAAGSPALPPRGLRDRPHCGGLDRPRGFSAQGLYRDEAVRGQIPARRSRWRSSSRRRGCSTPEPSSREELATARLWQPGARALLAP